MADGTPDLPEFARTSRAFVREESGEQFIVLPDAFRIDADEVSVRRDGDRLILEPLAPAQPPQGDVEWAAFWAEVDQARGDERLTQPERELFGEADREA